MAQTLGSTETMQNITVNERVPSQRFNSFVDGKIRAWMQDHSMDVENTEYEVAFFDEDSLGEVSCLVVIHSGEHLWRAWESSENPRRALNRSLERIHEDLGKAAVVTH